MKITVFSLMLIVLVVGCTKIDYVGEEYPPTTHVDLFFNMDDVERDHKIMGHVIATADDFVSAGKMQRKIMEEARKRGADAVVITGMEKYQAGETSTYKETTETKPTKKGSKSTTTATTTTKVDEKKEISGTFLKYQ